MRLTSFVQPEAVLERTPIFLRISNLPTGCYANVRHGPGLLLRMSSRFHRKYNCTNHAIHIVHHLVIPEANYLIALRFQIFRSFLVILFLFQMLTTIQFYDQFCFGRAKIGNVIPNSMFGDSCHLPPDGCLRPPRAVSSQIYPAQFIPA